VPLAITEKEAFPEVEHMFASEGDVPIVTSMHVTATLIVRIKVCPGQEPSNGVMV
jgi:hypothetical protein